MKKINYTITAIGTAILLATTAKFTISNSTDNKFTYEMDEDNNIIVNGKVKYEEAKNYLLARIYTEDGKPEIKIVKSERESNENNKYIDISNENELAREIKRPVIMKNGTRAYETYLLSNYKCRIWENIEEYLQTYNMVQSDYESEDMENLISMIEKDYDFENDRPNSPKEEYQYIYR